MNLVGPWGTPHWADSASTPLRRRGSGRTAESMGLTDGGPQFTPMPGPGAGVGRPAGPQGVRTHSPDAAPRPFDPRVHGVPSGAMRWWPRDDGGASLFPSLQDDLRDAAHRRARQSARRANFGDLAPSPNHDQRPCGDPPFLGICEAPLVKARDCEGFEVLTDPFFNWTASSGRRYEPPTVVPRSHIHPPGLRPSAPTWEDLRESGQTMEEGALRVELARIALDIISANLDIVEWIGCALSPGLGQCLMKHFQDDVRDIWGAHQRVNIGFAYLEDRIFGQAFDFPSWLSWFLFGFVPVPILGLPACDIWLPLDGIQYWDSFMTWSRSPDAAMEQGLPSVACIATSLAATLVHEMTHCCMWENGLYGKDESRHCFVTFRIKSAFQWAMAKRYPCELGPGSDCALYGSDVAFFADTYQNLADVF